MYQRAISFQNLSNGKQVLFTRSDFYTIQSWAMWMALSHNHDGVNTNKVKDTSILIHRDSVHGSAERPLGFENVNSSALDVLLAEHAKNSDIHQKKTSSSVITEGKLVARGWTEPIFVRAIISLPIFDILGYSERGPVFMPFPVHNMAPRPMFAPNYVDNINVETSDLLNSRLYILANGGVSPDGVCLPSKGRFVQFDSIYNKIPTSGTGAQEPDNGTETPPTVAEQIVTNEDVYQNINKTALPTFGELTELPELDIDGYEYLKPFMYPYAPDAKDRSNSAYWNQFQQFLYIIPSYLNTKLNINSELDAVLGTSFADSSTSVFFHQPLFVDAKDKEVIKRIRRSGITKTEIVNFKDLIGTVKQDSEKQDLFDSSDYKICWLSRYKPILTRDPDSTSGMSASLFFHDYEQEVNQFMSQVNYFSPSKYPGTEFADYPFKVVTVNFNVYPRYEDDPSLISKYDSIHGCLDDMCASGFPNCFYRTDFTHYYSKAGGHVEDIKRPKEDFFFNVYPSGLVRFREWFYNKYRNVLFPPDQSIDQSMEVFRLWENQITGFFDYFDKLNVPYKFSSGKRQVLILKDHFNTNSNTLFKKNPFNYFRSAAYAIVEGYVTVPYEAYATPFSSMELLSGGEEIRNLTTLELVATPAQGESGGTVGKVPFVGSGSNTTSSFVGGPSSPISGDVGDDEEVIDDETDGVGDVITDPGDDGSEDDPIDIIDTGETGGGIVTDPDAGGRDPDDTDGTDDAGGTGDIGGGDDHGPSTGGIHGPSTGSGHGVSSSKQLNPSHPNVGTSGQYWENPGINSPDYIESSEIVVEEKVPPQMLIPDHI